MSKRPRSHDPPPISRHDPFSFPPPQSSLAAGIPTYPAQNYPNLMPYRPPVYMPMPLPPYPTTANQQHLIMGLPTHMQAHWMQLFPDPVTYRGVSLADSPPPPVSTNGESTSSNTLSATKRKKSRPVQKLANESVTSSTSIRDDMDNEGEGDVVVMLPHFSPPEVVDLTQDSSSPLPEDMQADVSLLLPAAVAAVPQTQVPKEKAQAKTKTKTKKQTRVIAKTTPLDEPTPASAPVSKPVTPEPKVTQATPAPIQVAQSVPVPAPAPVPVPASIVPVLEAAQLQTLPAPATSEPAQNQPAGQALVHVVVEPSSVINDADVEPMNGLGTAKGRASNEVSSEVKKGTKAKKKRSTASSASSSSTQKEDTGDALYSIADEMYFLGSKSKRSKGEELDLQEELFDVDFDCKRSNEERLCAFCNRNHAEGVKLQDYLGKNDEAELAEESTELDDESGVWVSRYPMFMTRNPTGRQNAPVWVHLVCALWAPRTVRKQGRWFNIIREVRRSRQLKCKHCGQRGASIGCTVQSCPISIHFPCALEQGWTPSTFAAGVNPYFCPGHAAQRQAARIAKDNLCARDIARGREQVPVTAASLPAALKLAQQFTYVTSVIDSDEYSIPANATHVHCCSCTDLCNDVTKCACLQRMNSRAYSVTGMLFNPRPPFIAECGLRCRCHKQQCTNRIAGRGLQHRLQVSSASDGTWLLTAVQAIPQGAFVCELIGQVVRGRSVLDALRSQNPAVCVLGRWEDLAPRADADIMEEPCVDARRFGNVGRFVKFNDTECNLARVNVFGGPHDPTVPRLAYFATKNIAPGEVLSAPFPKFL